MVLLGILIISILLNSGMGFSTIGAYGRLLSADVALSKLYELEEAVYKLLIAMLALQLESV